MKTLKDIVEKKIFNMPDIGETVAFEDKVGKYSPNTEFEVVSTTSNQMELKYKNDESIFLTPKEATELGYYLV